MFLKNLSACLITINVPHDVKYDKADGKGAPKADAKVVDVIRTKTFKLLPAGPAVEIPGNIAKNPMVAKQIKHWVKSGDVTEVTASTAAETKQSGDEGDFKGLSRAELVESAKACEIDVTDDMTDADIIKALQNFGG